MDETLAEVVLFEVDDSAFAAGSARSGAGSGLSTGVRDRGVAVGALAVALLIVGFVFFDGADGDWHWKVGAEAPISQRYDHVSVWTGRELVVWGGLRTTEPGVFETLDDGAAYDPATDTWRPLAPSPLAGRGGAGAVWTGTEILVLATRQGGVQPTRDGAAYNPATDTWRILPEFDHTLGWGFLRTVDGTGYLRTRIGLVGRWLRVDNETGALTAVAGEGIPLLDPVSDLVPEMDLNRTFVDPAWTGTLVLEATGAFGAAADARHVPRWRAINPSTGTIVDLGSQPQGPVRVSAQGAWTKHGWIIWGGLVCDSSDGLCTTEGPALPLILAPP